jgi:ATP-dependent 26S proteasome regulatory subunit
MANVLLLLRDGEAPLAALVTRGERRMGESGLTVEVMAAERERGEHLLAELTRLMREHNVYRGRVLAFSRDEMGTVGVEIRTLPSVPREAIVLPAGVLERVERHALAPVRHRERLLAAGRHLKRGLLLHGPPGTGRTSPGAATRGRRG